MGLTALTRLAYALDVLKTEGCLDANPSTFDQSNAPGGVVSEGTGHGDGYIEECGARSSAGSTKQRRFGGVVGWWSSGGALLGKPVSCSRSEYPTRPIRKVWATSSYLHPVRIEPGRCEEAVACFSGEVDIDHDSDLELWTRVSDQEM